MRDALDGGPLWSAGKGDLLGWLALVAREEAVTAGRQPTPSMLVEQWFERFDEPGPPACRRLLVRRWADTLDALRYGRGMSGSDLYDTDVMAWSEHQAELLRRMAAGERVNDQVDWENVIEEIESVGRSELRAVASALRNATQHKLYLLGWPNALAVAHWQTEVRVILAEAAKDFRESMRRELAPDLPDLYRLARLGAERHVLEEGAPAAPLPDTCPWTLDELLAEGRAALRRPG